MIRREGQGLSDGPAQPALENVVDRVARRRDQSAPLALNDFEISILRQWAQTSGPLAGRAKAILGAAQTGNVAAISRYAGVHRATVYALRDRFRLNRLQGIAPHGIVALTPAQLRQLEDWEQSDNQQLAKRAKLILELVETSDLAAAASRAGVSMTSARLWRSAFRRCATEGLARPSALRAAKLRKLTYEEQTALREWAHAGTGVSRRAQIVLGLSGGQPVKEIARAAGVSKQTVWHWRRRFVNDGLKAIAPRSVAASLADDRRVVEGLRADPNSPHHKRARVIVGVTESGDRVCPARRGGVSVASARTWRKLFGRNGVSGVRGDMSELAPSAVPLVFPMQLAVELRFEERGGEAAILHGRTTAMCSRWMQVSMLPPVEHALQEFGGKRVVADIGWPASGPDGEHIILRVKGSTNDAGPRAIQVSIRTFDFIRPEAPSELKDGCTEPLRRPATMEDEAILL